MLTNYYKELAAMYKCTHVADVAGKELGKNSEPIWYQSLKLVNLFGDTQSAFEEYDHKPTDEELAATKAKLLNTWHEKKIYGLGNVHYSDTSIDLVLTRFNDFVRIDIAEWKSQLIGEWVEAFEKKHAEFKRPKTKNKSL